MLAHGVSKDILTPLFAATSHKAELLNGKVRDTRSYIDNGSYRSISIEQLLVPWVRVGNIRESILECCAQVHLWVWLEAQTNCFERTNYAESHSSGDRSTA